MHHSSVGESPDAIDGEAHVRATGSLAESNTDIISTEASKGSRDSKPEVTKTDKQSTDRRHSNERGKWIRAEIRAGKQPLGKLREENNPDRRTSTEDNDTVARTSKVNVSFSGLLASPRSYRSGQRLTFW